MMSKVLSDISAISWLMLESSDWLRKSYMIRKTWVKICLLVVRNMNCRFDKAYGFSVGDIRHTWVATRYGKNKM